MEPIGKSEAALSPQPENGKDSSRNATPPSHLKATQKFAAERTAMLLGCFRRDEANDPKIYTAAVIATLANYSPDVVRYVTDPLTGLPRKLKFLPSIAEIVEACEDHVRHLAKREEARRWNARKPMEPKPPPPRVDGTDYFSMFAKYGRPIGYFERGAT